MIDFQKTPKQQKKSHTKCSHGLNVQWPHEDMSSMGIAKPAQMIPRRAMNQFSGNPKNTPKKATVSCAQA
jgi:hypothetical protein